jgi:dihydropteroate synthase
LQIKKISNNINFKELLKKIDVDSGGINILNQKSNMNLFYIQDLKVGGANILKQDCLSIGADLAVPKGTVTAKTSTVNAVLIATDRQLQKLSTKELAQPFGLKDIAVEIKKYLKTKHHDIKIMGVINANDDSFFEGSRFKGDDAIKKIEQFIKDGANIIDIGAVSSRPNSKVVSQEEELHRIKPIVDKLYNSKIYETTTLSVDSFQPEVIKYCLDNGFKIVNDITGLNNDKVAKISGQYNATVVIMHMQGNPQNMQNNPKYHDVIFEVEDFFTQRIQKAQSFGIEDIILDVGIGFGKTLEHNISLIQNLEHFKKFDKELLIGASRKSMIDHITKTNVQDRLTGTLTIHQQSINNGASIIRCHDVKEHNDMVKIYKALNTNLV